MLFFKESLLLMPSPTSLQSFWRQESYFISLFFPCRSFAYKQNSIFVCIYVFFFFPHPVPKRIGSHSINICWNNKTNQLLLCLHPSPPTIFFTLSYKNRPLMLLNTFHSNVSNTINLKVVLVPNLFPFLLLSESSIPGVLNLSITDNFEPDNSFLESGRRIYPISTINNESYKYKLQV